MQFRCCGVTNHTDWFEVYNASRVPDSCCLEYSDNCGLYNPGTWWTAVSSCTFVMSSFMNKLDYIFTTFRHKLSNHPKNCATRCSTKSMLFFISMHFNGLPTREDAVLFACHIYSNLRRQFFLRCNLYIFLSMGLEIKPHMSSKSLRYKSCDIALNCILFDKFL